MPAPWRFKYRYVDFGTFFTPELGIRAAGDITSPSKLYLNELALDVGSVCLGSDVGSPSVIDHHFVREAQFPSASAAVLHLSHGIHQIFLSRQLSTDIIWLVTHKQTDFDAFCAMYLARTVLLHEQYNVDWRKYGLSTEGWSDVSGPDGSTLVPKIDWFAPEVFRSPPELRWQVLLAAYASCVDNCRRLRCPRNKTLHSILYAALTRGRGYSNEDSGAVEFFDEVKTCINEKQLNPLFDSVLEGNSLFAPELEMLDHELEAYQRDIKRSRTAVVDVPRWKDFQYNRAKQESLLNDNSVAVIHKRSPNESTAQFDGIYIRDPECILFKEWARLDTENSSTGQGFSFTAVGYSDNRPEGRLNTTDYFFALDPEKAWGYHLYYVWAALQVEEINAFKRKENLGYREQLEKREAQAATTFRRTQCRPGFEKRAGEYAALLDDPWFDGSNFNCTIVATPNRGTIIGNPGSTADLSDDTVAQIVQRELELSIYEPDAYICDVAHSNGSDADKCPEEPTYRITDNQGIPSLDRGFYRMVRVKLHPDVDVLKGRMHEQIGSVLWRLLNPELRKGLPADFLQRHLLVSDDWVGVWSRRGIAVAYTPKAADTIDGVAGLKQRFKEMASVLRDAESFIQGSRSEIGTDLVQRAAQLQHALADPANRLLNRFFESTRLDEVLTRVSDVNTATRLENNTRIVADVQTKVEWLEIFFVSFYAAELTYLISESLKPYQVPHSSLILLLCSGAFAAAATWMLQPFKHGHKRGMIFLVLLGILYAAGLYIAVHFERVDSLRRGFTKSIFH
jgi:hypothetical protein